MAKFLGVEDIPLDKLTEFPGNARRGDVEGVRTSLRAHGQYRSLVVRKLPNGYQILCGNHTAKALKAEGTKNARCEVIECSDVDAVKINVGDNRWSDQSENDEEALLSLLEGLEGDFEGTGYDAGDFEALYEAVEALQSDGLDWRQEGDPATEMPPLPSEQPALADRFLIPPFDVLDARQGWWKERKRKWLDLGIHSTSGRDGAWVDSIVRKDPDFYDKKDAMSRKLGRELTAKEFEEEYYEHTGSEVHSGISVFDPVMCELAYRWYSSPGATVIDPFSGGSVRGLVASMLQRVYIGNDLSEEQVSANIAQCKEFAERKILGPTPTWSVGDSVLWKPEPESADLMFTCPPYYDLEKYSDAPDDLSAMSDKEFGDAYRQIMGNCAVALRENRFAVMVTGDARDRRGNLRDLRRLTVDCAENAGLKLVSAAVMLTPVASAKISAGRNFLAGGILARVHQDVLVFCKGDRKKAASWRGTVDMEDPEGLTEA